MTEFKIEKGVPLPPKKSGGRGRKHPFYEMEVGDSVLVVGKERNIVSGLVGNPSRKYGFKFATRAVEGGVRVWRIA